MDVTEFREKLIFHSSCLSSDRANWTYVRGKTDSLDMQRQKRKHVSEKSYTRLLCSSILLVTRETYFRPKDKFVWASLDFRSFGGTTVGRLVILPVKRTAGERLT